MTQSNRRQFIALAAASTALLAADKRGAKAAAASSATSLKEALSKRRSIRLYADEPIAEDMLGELLWSAAGINRPGGGRTAPSWHTSYGTDIYVADAGGVRRFDAVAGSLVPTLAEDIRRKASPQPFVAAAPMVLIYVADLARMYEAPTDEQVQAAHVDAGIIAQNVYLYCASVGLGTCLVGGADKPGLKAILNLPEDQLVTFVQPIGHPKFTR